MKRAPRRDFPERPTVLVLGAGLTGLATLGELARAGIDATAVDPHGVGWGSSGLGPRHLDFEWGRAPWRSTSTGALRWRERSELVRAARHVVRPTPMLLPLRRGESLQGGRRARLSFGLNKLGAHDDEWPAPLTLDAEQRTLLLPGFRFGDEGVTRAVYGAIVEDQRLVELRAMQARLDGGCLLTRSELVALESSSGGHARATLRDRIDGEMRELAVTAVIDATGAWSSQVTATWGVDARELRGQRRLVGAALPCRIDAGARALHLGNGSRMSLAPAPGGMVLSHVIESRASGSFEALPTAEERATLDEFLEDAFPALPGSRRLYWSTALAGENPGRPSPVSPRRLVAGVPFFSVSSLGPDLHAHAARLVRARVAHELKHQSTRRLREAGHLPGGDIASVPGAEASARALGLSEVQARWMVLRYGSQWESLLELEGGLEALGQAGIPLACEIPWLFDHEGMRTLADVLRSWRAPEITTSHREERNLLEAALVLASRLRGWSPARQEREAARWWKERALRFVSTEEVS